MNITKLTGTDMNEVIDILSRGGLVVFPCETVYGVAVDALNPKAVIKLNTYKQRPPGKPYAIMANSQEMAEEYAYLNATARGLYKRFLPGPLTVISNGKHKLAAGIESETGSVGVRIPDYGFLLELISKLGHPIAATSANAAYKKRPYKIADVLENISEKQKDLLDLIIDAGELPHNEPSTVIDTTLDDPMVLRLGTIKLNNKNEVVSRSAEDTKNIGKEIWQKYQAYQDHQAIVFALEGEMGAGKTQFTKGLAAAAGIAEEIVSPTYNLELDYEKNFVHIDAWRLASGEELINLGWKKRITEKSTLCVEWADRVADAVREQSDQALIVWIKIRYGKRENERVIEWGTI